MERKFCVAGKGLEFKSNNCSNFEWLLLKHEVNKSQALLFFQFLNNKDKVKRESQNVYTT